MVCVLFMTNVVLEIKCIELHHRWSGSSSACVCVLYSTACECVCVCCVCGVCISVY